MCLIVLTEKEKPISDELFKDFMSKNRDGFGFMWIQDNKVQTFKTHENKLDLLLEKYNETKDFNPIIHFRMKTHGAIDHENTHPYYVDFGIWLMHNGVFNAHGNSGSDKSDTWHFIKDLLRPLLKQAKDPHVFIRSEAFGVVMNSYMAGQRVIMMDRGGAVLFNKSSWHEINNEDTGCKGMLVSNAYAWDAYGFGRPKSQAVVVVPSGTTYGRGRYDSVYGSPDAYQEKWGSYNWDRRPLKEQMTPLPNHTTYFYDKIGYVWEEYATGCYRRVASKDHLAEEAMEAAKKKIEGASASESSQGKQSDSSGERPPFSDQQLCLNLHQPVETSDDDEDNESFNFNIAAYLDYKRELIIKWRRYTDEELETAFWTDYDEALIIMKEGLKNAVV